jgi:alanyl-tRNA synthetase
MRKPAAGMITHVGIVTRGNPKVGDSVVAKVDIQRRQDIMRNHTATHLLHAVLHKVLGEHARQSGSLVAPEKLRFDFTHPDPISQDQLETIEALVNEAILSDYPLIKVEKPLEKAMSEGAMALFGEKYGETVRTITIGEETPFSYELCGGTHVDDTGDIGIFIILSEGSAAAGIRRIEAVTGREAYKLIQKRFKVLKRVGAVTGSPVEAVADEVSGIMDKLENVRKENITLNQQVVFTEFAPKLDEVNEKFGFPVLTSKVSNADEVTQRLLTDRFRDRYPTGIMVSGSVVHGIPIIVAACTDDLVARGFNMSNLVKEISPLIGGSGGGRPTLAQARGKDPEGLDSALFKVTDYVQKNLK